MTAASRLQPAPLRAGSRVALISPSGPPDHKRMQQGAALLRNWGLAVVVGPHALDTHQLDYLAGDDRSRAADLQNAWLDPSIDAVICARGGYGAQRIIEHLDFEAMRQVPPKILAGYSDITALHQAFATQLGITTLHAPMPACEPFLSSEASREHLHQMLFGTSAGQELRPENLGLAPARRLVPGKARGDTVGGCLSLLSSEIGSPVRMPHAGNSLILLEDVDEKPYLIDSMLTQLLRAGWFDHAAGIIIGSWHDCGDPEEIDHVVMDRLGPLNIPMVADFGFGHGPVSLTIPLGVSAELDADQGLLRIA